MRLLLSTSALLLSACLCSLGPPPTFACTDEAPCDAGSTEDAGGTGGGGTVIDPFLLFLPIATVRAAACVPVSVELTGASFERSVVLSASPPGLLLFSDAACTTALQARPLGPSAARLTAYVRALTAQTYTVTAASSGLMSATLSFPVLPMVRRGQCELSNGVNSTVCVIDPPQENLAETWLIYQATGTASNDHSSLSVRCTLGSTTGVLCERLGTTGQVAIAWQTVELPGLRVQRADLACDGTGSRTLTFPFGVDPARSFATYAVKQTGAYWSSNDAFAATVRASAIDLEWESVCDENATVTAQLAEWPGATVTRGTLTLDAGTVTLETAALPSTQAAFALATWSTTAGIADAPCASMLRVSTSSSTRVAFTRGAAGTCLARESPRLSWERIDLGRFGRVQQLTLGMNAGEGTARAPVQPYDATRTVVFAGGQTGGQGLAMGEGLLDSKSSVSDFAATFRLSADQVLAERRSTTAASRWSVFVVELSP